MSALTMSILFSIAVCLLIGGILFGAHFAVKFWEWYDDAVWDEQEEDRPEPDDFPERK